MNDHEDSKQLAVDAHHRRIQWIADREADIAKAESLGFKLNNRDEVEALAFEKADRLRKIDELLAS